MSRAKTEYRYEKLTWPEINDAVDLGKVCIVPCGAVEQHGPHLPLDVDLVCPGGIATGAGQAIPDKMLVLPIVAYGYTGHVMDFPGTINNDFEHFMHHVLDITKSLAYHGFKKIILLNGHGSNMPNLDLVARRTNLETDAECVLRRVVEPADRGQGRSCRAGGRASSPAAAPTPANWKRRCICTSTATTSARTRSRAARSASTRRTARSTGSICSRPARRRSSRGRAVTPTPACSARRNWRPPRRAGKPTRKR